jgi:hypothetical protein
LPIDRQCMATKDGHGGLRLQAHWQHGMRLVVVVWLDPRQCCLHEEAAVVAGECLVRRSSDMEAIEDHPHPQQLVSWVPSWGQQMLLAAGCAWRGCQPASCQLACWELLATVCRRNRLFPVFGRVLPRTGCDKGSGLQRAT